MHPKAFGCGYFLADLLVVQTNPDPRSSSDPPSPNSVKPFETSNDWVTSLCLCPVFYTVYGTKLYSFNFKQYTCSKHVLLWAFGEIKQCLNIGSVLRGASSSLVRVFPSPSLWHVITLTSYSQWVLLFCITHICSNYTSMDYPRRGDTEIKIGASCVSVRRRNLHSKMLSRGGTRNRSAFQSLFGNLNPFVIQNRRAEWQINAFVAVGSTDSSASALHVFRCILFFFIQLFTEEIRTPSAPPPFCNHGRR